MEQRGFSMSTRAASPCQSEHSEKQASLLGRFEHYPEAPQAAVAE